MNSETFFLDLNSSLYMRSVVLTWGHDDDIVALMGCEKARTYENSMELQ